LTTQPWIVLPSIQRVASLWLSHSRSTRFPAHSFGTVALTRNQYVAQSGRVATALGAHPTVVASTVLYVLAAAVLLVVPWPGTLDLGKRDREQAIGEGRLDAVSVNGAG